nr:hypothetical protein [Tanacetum cinerariifolium]
MGIHNLNQSYNHLIFSQRLTGETFAETAVNLFFSKNAVVTTNKRKGVHVFLANSQSSDCFVFQLQRFLTRGPLNTKGPSYKRTSVNRAYGGVLSVGVVGERFVNFSPYLIVLWNTQDGLGAEALIDNDVPLKMLEQKV